MSVHQCVPEPLLPVFPVDQKMFDKHGRCDHSHPIVHPSGLPELTHAGVNNRKAGTSFLPIRERIVIFDPWEL